MAAIYASSDGGAGRFFHTFSLENTSKAACKLTGFVTVEQLDAEGNVVPTRVSQSGEPRVVVLEPSQKGHFTVSTSEVPLEPEEVCRTAQRIRIVLPGGSEAIEIPVLEDDARGPLVVCEGSGLGLTPIEKG